MFFNVYKIVPQVKYAFGVALIAAFTKEDAIKVFCEDDYNKYLYDDFSYSCEVIPNMNYMTNAPQVIFNCIHDE